MIQEMEKIQDTVKRVLMEHPSTRNSDTDLYIAVCKEVNPTACRLTLVDAFEHRKELGLPNYESVGRARRRLQSKYKELRACTAVEHQRAENYEEMKEWALS